MARITVLGIGNVLMGDDAAGPHVVKVLEAAYAFPPDVAVVEAGTPGLDLTALLDGVETLLVVDSVHARAPPGTIRVYDRAKLLERPPALATSPHEPGLREALLTMDFHGAGPREVWLVGVVPGQVTTGIGLTPEVRAAVPRLVAEVVSRLAALGAAPTSRVPPGVPDLWWERGPGQG
jgi:hydrogenase maturation protease